jgi:hypothetical protein
MDRVSTTATNPASYSVPLGLKAEFPRMNAGVPTIAARHHACSASSWGPNLDCTGFATMGGLGRGAERSFPPPQQEIK